MYTISVVYETEDGCVSFARLPVDDWAWSQMALQDKGSLVATLALGAEKTHTECPLHADTAMH